MISITMMDMKARLMIHLVLQKESDLNMKDKRLYSVANVQKKFPGGLYTTRGIEGKRLPRAIRHSEAGFHG
jgi:hypothetical protein